MGGMRDGYIEVNDRIAAFYAKHPEGTLRGDWDIKEVGEQTFIVYRAEALRSPKDREPGVGHAWEPFPGKTPFTKDSELMNAETSAWGRAIAALGFEVREGIATKEDVAARSGAAPKPKSKDPYKGFAPGGKQRPFFERLLKQAGAPQETADLICSWASTEYDGVSRSITTLKGEGSAKPEEHVRALQAKAEEWNAKQTDTPADTSGLTDKDRELQESAPF